MPSTDPDNVDNVKITGKFSILTKEDLLNHDATQSQIKRIDDAEDESKRRKEAEIKAAEQAKLRKQKEEEEAKKKKMASNAGANLMAGFMKQGTIKKVEDRQKEEEKKEEEVKEEPKVCTKYDAYEKELEKENEELALILQELDAKIEEGTMKLAAALDAQKAEETSPYAIEKQKLELTLYHMK